jgi:hypothetical protein
MSGVWSAIAIVIRFSYLDIMQAAMRTARSTHTL